MLDNIHLFIVDCRRSDKGICSMKKIELNLANHSFGRIILHLVGMVRAGHVRWHISGILREF